MFCHEVILRYPVQFEYTLLKVIFNFQELFLKVQPYIEGQKTQLRIPVPAEEKLAVTLRFLATGESFRSLMYQFRIHHSTISKFIPQVLDAIYNVLKDDYLKCPSTQTEWLELADRTYDRWQFPNAYAAADGKHIALLHPSHSGSEFYNYKGFFSIVLMALVDYDYKFLYVDVGCQGRISDGGIFRNSSFHANMVNNKLDLPPPRPLPKSNADSWKPLESDDAVPFVFVADNAFPLTNGIMKPYPEKGLTDIKKILDTDCHAIDE